MLLAGVALFAAACGSGSVAASKAPSAPPHTGSSASIAKVDCASVNSLRGSLESLSHTRISATSAGTLTSDLKNIQVQLAKLHGHASGQFASQLNGLTASLDQITKAANELRTNPVTAIEQLTKSLDQLKGKVGPLSTEMNKECPK